MRSLLGTAGLLAALSAFSASAEAPGTQPRAAGAKAVGPLQIGGAPVLFPCPVVNMTLQFSPVGADAPGWNGHGESKSNVAPAYLTKRKNPGLGFDTVICVYNLPTAGGVIQDSALTIVERNPPPSHPICEGVLGATKGWSCRALKPNEKYQ